MARNIHHILPLCCVLLSAWADDHAHLRENERRWNTPPELTSEQVFKKPDMMSERQRSLSIPITTNINLNTGENTHSLGFQASPEGVSYPEINSSTYPLSETKESSSLSQSQSLSLSAGLTGISGATAHAIGHRDPVHGNQGNVDNHAFSIGNAAASSFGTVQNGHVSSGAASSVDSLHSSASSSAGSNGFPEGRSLTIEFPGRNNQQPSWTNIRPNHNNNGYHNSRPPKLNIDVRTQNGYNHGPIRLHVTAHETNLGERRPNVQIYKWRPSPITPGFYES